ncbi:LexA family protein, partial [Xanthomonas citri]
MPSLPPQRAAVLAFLQEQAQAGVSPSLAEIAQAFGFASRNAAQKHVQALADAGLIELLPNQKRGIRLPGGAGRDALLALPVLGRVAAGLPIGADIGL